ncbi:MAG: dipicolinate synthase subunit DpsA, partial [Acutalibacteraceae bacterium]
MINLKKVIIIGGDERQKRLCGLFENKCRCIYISNNSELEKEKFEDANLIILPLPVTKNGRDIYSDCGKIAVENVTNKLCKNNIVSGGLIDKKLKNKLSESGIKYFDYYADETFRIFNAYLTAQGAAKIVLENTEDFIVSKKILITGFGRVGKACARVL